MQNYLDPVTCTLCGVVWDRMADRVPTCSHTSAEWETFWSTATDRRQWAEIADPGVAPSENAVMEARARLAREK